MHSFPTSGHNVWRQCGCTFNSTVLLQLAVYQLVLRFWLCRFKTNSTVYRKQILGSDIVLLQLLESPVMMSFIEAGKYHIPCSYFMAINSRSQILCSYFMPYESFCIVYLHYSKFLHHHLFIIVNHVLVGE